MSDTNIKIPHVVKPRGVSISGLKTLQDNAKQQTIRPLPKARIYYAIFPAKVTEVVDADTIKFTQFGVNSDESRTNGMWTEQPATILTGRFIVDQVVEIKLTQAGDNGQMIFWASPWGGTSDSTDSIGITAETEAAQTDAWDITSQGANDGVVMTMQTRTAYNHDGDEKLYAYYRDFKYDSAGLLLEISAETRITIDTPGVCS